MIKFQQNGATVRVFADGILIGIIVPRKGLCMSLDHARGSFTLSSGDLLDIIEKVQELSEASSQNDPGAQALSP